MPRVILNTRPEPQAGVYHSMLEGEGYAVFTEPMLTRKTLAFDTPAPEGFQALVFTSASAVEVFAGENIARKNPVFTVGPQTQEAASAAGFQNVTSAQGTADELIAHVADALDPAGGPLLHVRGVYCAQDLKAGLVAMGFGVENLVVYEMENVPDFTPALIAKLEEGAIEVVTFFSKRTAENFDRLVRKHGLVRALGHIKALCISGAVLSYVQSLPWCEAYTAETPDRAGMNALIHAQSGLKRQP